MSFYWPWQPFFSSAECYVLIQQPTMSTMPTMSGAYKNIFSMLMGLAGQGNLVITGKSYQNVRKYFVRSSGMASPDLELDAARQLPVDRYMQITTKTK